MRWLSVAVIRAKGFSVVVIINRIIKCSCFRNSPTFATSSEAHRDSINCLWLGYPGLSPAIMCGISTYQSELVGEEITFIPASSQPLRSRVRSFISPPSAASPSQRPFRTQRSAFLALRSKHRRNRAKCAGFAGEVVHFASSVSINLSM